MLGETFSFMWQNKILPNSPLNFSWLDTYSKGTYAHRKLTIWAKKHGSDDWRRQEGRSCHTLDQLAQKLESWLMLSVTGFNLNFNKRCLSQWNDARPVRKENLKYFEPPQGSFLIYLLLVTMMANSQNISPLRMLW